MSSNFSNSQLLPKSFGGGWCDKDQQLNFLLKSIFVLFIYSLNHLQLLLHSLNPSSFTHSLQIYYIGLAGLEFTHFLGTVLKPSPYNIFNKSKNVSGVSCVLSIAVPWWPWKGKWEHNMKSTTPFAFSSKKLKDIVYSCLTLRGRENLFPEKVRNPRDSKKSRIAVM